MRGIFNTIVVANQASISIKSDMNGFALEEEKWIQVNYPLASIAYENILIGQTIRHCFEKHAFRNSHKFQMQRTMIGCLKRVDKLIIDWVTIPPAPNTVLEFVSLNSVKSFDNNCCTCRSNGLKCTDMCKLKNFSNSVIGEDFNTDNESESDEDNNY